LLPYFKAKMYHIRFRLGLCPTPCRGSLQRSPNPLAVFKGPILLRGGKERGKERKGQGKGKLEWGREGRGRKGHSRLLLSLTPDPHAAAPHLFPRPNGGYSPLNFQAPPQDRGSNQKRTTTDG